MKVTYKYGIDGVSDTVYDNVEFGNKYGTNVPEISVVRELGKVKNMEFAGWYHPEVTSNSDVMMDTDHTVYAMWEPHKVSFSAGYSRFTDAVPDITVKRGEGYGVLPTPRSTDMYKFSYWTYEDGDEYVVCDTGSELAVAANHTLTANWSTRRFVKFIYENENGEETTKGCSQMYGYAYRGVPTIPEKDGYTAKWVFSEEGSLYNGSEFFPGMLVIPDHPITIRAVYTAVTTD